MFAVAADPYARTLWTYCHLLQREKLDELQRRSEALYQADLMAKAFHQPSMLRDDRRDLQREAGLLPVGEEARAQLTDFASEIAQLDQAGAWKPMGGVA